MESISEAIDKSGEHADLQMVKGKREMDTRLASVQWSQEPTFSSASLEDLRAH